MMSIPNGYEFGPALCKALKLDGHRVKKIVIEVDADEPVRVYVQMLLDEGSVAPLLECVAAIPVKDVTVDMPVVVTPLDSRVA
jgi:hypothetical protein